MASIPQQHQPFPKQVVYYDWSFFDQGQKKWPIPSAFILISAFLVGVCAPRFGGRIAITAAFILAAFFPDRTLRNYLSKGDLIGLFSITACGMMLGNLDALGDLLGSDVFRFSWISLLMAAVAIPGQLKILKGPVASCSVLVGMLIIFYTATAVGNTSIFRSIELNGSYMAAFLLSLICLTKREMRDSLIYHLALLAMVNCGFCLFEIVFSSSSITISSSRLQDVTIRSAGIYANAIVSGMMMSAFLLLVAMGCTKISATRKEKLSLAVMMGLVGVGVLATFSRSAAIAYLPAAVLVAFRMADSRFSRLSRYFPIVLFLVAAGFFGTGEYLTAKGNLRGGASRRYQGVKEILGGDFAPVTQALNERSSAWQPSKRYWKKPTLTGYGHNFLAENGVFPPHNMVIITICETGIIGLLFFITVLLFLCNFGKWPMSSMNMFLFASVLGPILILILESHSLFLRRYFALHLVMLVFVTAVLLNPRKINK